MIEDLLGMILILVVILAIILFLIIPHAETCDCLICYEFVGKENGIRLYKDREGNLNYYNQYTENYIEIIEFDNTPYTYNEYKIKHSNELEDKINDLFGQ